MLIGVVALAVQIVVPLRHQLYPGSVRWNEEGYRFGWRVLLTEKVGSGRVPRDGPFGRAHVAGRSGDVSECAAGGTDDDAAGRDFWPRRRSSATTTPRRGGMSKCARTHSSRLTAGRTRAWPIQRSTRRLHGMAWVRNAGSCPSRRGEACWSGLLGAADELAGQRAGQLVVFEDDLTVADRGDVAGGALHEALRAFG